MSWRVEWSPAADRDVLQMSWQLATRICSAVLLFAERGAGHVESTEQPGVVRLRVPGAVALLRRDKEDRSLHVLRLYATR